MRRKVDACMRGLGRKRCRFRFPRIDDRSPGYIVIPAMLSAGRQHARHRSVGISHFILTYGRSSVFARRYASQVQHTSAAAGAGPVRQVIFSGIQPTGVPHLGNYLGALQQWVQIQDKAPAATTLIYSIVDLHAITVRQDVRQLRRWKRETLAILLAVGLDPQRSTIFYQSAVRSESLTTVYESMCQG